MPVDVSDPIQAAGQLAVRGPLGEIRGECAGFARFVEETLSQFDRLRIDLDTRQRQLLSEREHLTLERKELHKLREALGGDGASATLTADREALQAARRDAEELRRQLDHLRATGAAHAEGTERWEARLREIEAQRDSYRTQLDHAAAEIMKLAAVATQLSDTRGQLADARAEILKLRDQLAAAPPTALPTARQPSAPPPAPSIYDSYAPMQNDPVLGSLMAQFAQLHKEAAERRQGR